MRLYPVWKDNPSCSQGFEANKSTPRMPPFLYIKVFSEGCLSCICIKFDATPSPSQSNLIAQLLNVQNDQEMIHHDFIDTFMSDNAIPCIISGQLVIDFFIRRFFIQGNVEINRRDVCI